ncbi:MAG: beta-ketoacyl synthase, partial [Desulfobacterales bacterium]|nr:beta-ketoacyl synthase [Desulfobacterales bacterium]
EDALACGDTIHGVIQGYGVSNDIEGNLVAPASEGQIRAMAAAYHMAGWSPAQVQYMECHGSGTPVGDNIELSSIDTLLNTTEYAAAGPISFQRPLSIGSVKSNIGHLLTGAGAAGFIKTVAAMGRKTLPPSLNFDAPGEDSLLNQGRIQVQKTAQAWEADTDQWGRRAAVSAFGFGGINAHLLVEEYQPRRVSVPVGTGETDLETAPLELEPCAIVGMGCMTRDAADLNQFSSLIFGETVPDGVSPAQRWQNNRPPAVISPPEQARFMESLAVELGEFHIPPNQLRDILPQHLVLLKAGKAALEDAGITPRPNRDSALRHRMGAAVGIDFDFGAADFQMRWKHHDLAPELKDQMGPPLDFNRTLGALGGIVASRTAREFKLGGPCFTLSAKEASAHKALEVAQASLSSRETDIFICGCVDMCGDIRQFTLDRLLNPAHGANSATTGEGAGALVLKRLSQAQRDGDRIYGVIQATAAASAITAGAPTETAPGQIKKDKKSYRRALQSLLEDQQIRFSQITQVEMGSMGPAGEMESQALCDIAKAARSKGCHLGWTPGQLGMTGTASGMFSLMKTALGLYKKQIPACPASGENWMDSAGAQFTLNPAPAAAPENAMALVTALATDGALAQALVSAPPAPVKDMPLSSAPDPKAERGITLPIQSPCLPEPVLAAMGNSSPQKPSQEPSQAEPIATPQWDFPQPEFQKDQTGDGRKNFVELWEETALTTARAHEKFLTLSHAAQAQMEAQYAQLTRLASQLIQGKDVPMEGELPPLESMPQFTPPDAPDPKTNQNRSTGMPASQPTPVQPKPAYDRDMCMELAVGKIGKVFGPDFDIVDSYPVRVRLPAEPLMLVDRIVSIEGEPRSLGKGKIVTQHDVKPAAWYLDGGLAPVSISIEAGQADLVLCTYLGIDHAVKGSRKYRLLDAKVTFHRSLPRVGETIEYHIEIDRFLRQGDVYLFFFHYKGYVGNELLISMRDGCAGFFTEEEVENSGGIILKKDETQRVAATTQVTPLVAMEKTALAEPQVEALRAGNLEGAFGPAFAGIELGEAQRLPTGRMHLIDRVLELDPKGGRFGLGSIIAEADIHPDDWFLTCHFIDDMVMPGTLMYECCAHALRIFVQRMGWVSSDPAVHYNVLPANESDLKCRGPVTCETSKARYEIEIKELGYGPEPYVIADAHMFSDDLRIVLYKDMGMKLEGLTPTALTEFWRNK